MNCCFTGFGKEMTGFEAGKSDGIKQGKCG